MSPNLDGLNVSLSTLTDESTFSLRKLRLSVWKIWMQAVSIRNPGVIACEVIERISAGAGEIVKINSEGPWAIESVDGNVLFDVRPDQLVDS